MTLVEVGPVSIRGPAPVDDDVATAAVESIDDTVMLVADRPVAVRVVLADLVRQAAGADCGPLTVAHPSWWSGRRVEAVLEAAREVDESATAIRRAEMFGDGFAAVVEIAPDHVAVVSSGVSTIARSTDAAVCAAVRREIRGRGPVFVDSPPGVGDAPAAALVAALGERGVTATLTPAPVPAPPAAAGSPRRSRRRAGPVLAGALLTTVCVGAAALVPDTEPAPAEPTTLLVEGRVGVVVPALWTVHRITEGNGSARVQITSPTESAVALHITQSVLPRPQTLQQVADNLREALDAEDAGVFTDFNAGDQRGGRAVATYRERRAKHQTEWAVLADGALRIAIGCQSPPGQAEAVWVVCEAAVQSAHAVF